MEQQNRTAPSSDWELPLYRPTTLTEVFGQENANTLHDLYGDGAYGLQGPLFIFKVLHNIAFNNNSDSFNEKLNINVYNISSIDALMRIIPRSTSNFGVNIWVVSRDINKIFNYLKTDGAERFLQEGTPNDSRRIDDTLALYLMQSPYHKIKCFFSNNNGLNIFTNQTITLTTQRKIYAVLPKTVLAEYDYSNCKYPLDPEIFKLLTKPNKTEFIQAVQEWFTKNQIMKSLREQNIAHNLEQYHSGRKMVYTRRLDEELRRVERIERELHEKYIQIAKARQVIAFYDSISQNNNKELLQSLVNNNSIKHISMADPYSLQVLITTPCKNYNVDDMEGFINRTTKLSPIQRRVWTKLFLTQDYSLLMSSTFIIGDQSVDVYTGLVYNTYINPHLEYYRCFGDNYSPIQKSLINNDLTSVFILLTATTGNFNPLDGAVTDRAVHDINIESSYSKKPTIIDHTTNTLITITDLWERCSTEVSEENANTRTDE